MFKSRILAITAVLLGASMALAPSFASAAVNSTDTSTINVHNVKGDVTGTAYQVISVIGVTLIRTLQTHSTLGTHQ